MRTHFLLCIDSESTCAYVFLYTCVGAGVDMYICIHVYTFVGTCYLLDMSVCIHPFYLPSLHTILCESKRRSVTQLRFPLTAGQCRFSVMRVSPIVFVRCLFRPSLLFFSVPSSRRYCLHTVHLRD